MSQDYVLALDQGTTSSRAILFNREGRPTAIAQQEFEQLYPQPGWVEHRPNDIWHSQLNAAERGLLDKVPGARALAEKGKLAFGTVDSWLIWKLTGGRIHATDPSNASRTLLFNIARGEWDDDLLGTLNVPRELLPHVTPSSAMLG